MARLNAALLAFNRGRISPLALARTDIERVALSAEIQTNWMPRILGSMMLRPGFGYLNSTYTNARSISLNFIYALSDQAEIELTANAMRVLVDDVVITRPSVSSTIANGTFDSNLTGWTDADESGAVTVDWVVLTAAIVGLGMVVMTTVGGGIEGLGDAIVADLGERAAGYENQ